jgi:hypothetical protein
LDFLRDLDFPVPLNNSVGNAQPGQDRHATLATFAGAGQNARKQ